MSRAQDLLEHAEHVGSGPHDGPRCVCRHDGRRWLRLCMPAQVAADALHVQAQYEHWRSLKRDADL